LAKKDINIIHNFELAAFPPQAGRATGLRYVPNSSNEGLQI